MLLYKLENVINKIQKKKIQKKLSSLWPSLWGTEIQGLHSSSIERSSSVVRKRLLPDSKAPGTGNPLLEGADSRLVSCFISRVSEVYFLGCWSAQYGVELIKTWRKLFTAANRVCVPWLKAHRSRRHLHDWSKGRFGVKIWNAPFTKIWAQWPSDLIWI